MALTKKQIAKALKSCGGFVSQTAKKLNVSASNIYAWMDRHPELKELKQDIEESYLDLAETKLLKLVDSADLGAVCFYLKCKGKKRGYVEKQVIANTHVIEKNLDDFYNEEGE